jgi:hypothetical protein
MGRRASILICLVAVLVLASPETGALAEAVRAKGQLLYVPVYSEIPYGDRDHTLNLTATLSVRNTDRRHTIALQRVDYHNAGGGKLRAYNPETRLLAPLAAVEFVVKESDRSGGISASFLVEWDSALPVSPPLVEAVMISTASAQGVSFTSPARVLEERR